MVLATHVIISAYGFWLPNDPRGSWSDFVGSLELLRHGPATKVSTSRSLACEAHDISARRAAKTALKHPPVRLNGLQARAIGQAFAERLHRSQVIAYACAILPDHVHLVLGRHPRLRIETIVNHLKGAATRRLVADGLHPLVDAGQAPDRPPRMWSRGFWKVFLNRAADVLRAIRYVEENPVKDGLLRQNWKFVVPYTE